MPTYQWIGEDSDRRGEGNGRSPRAARKGEVRLSKKKHERERESSSTCEGLKEKILFMPRLINTLYNYFMPSIRKKILQLFEITNYNKSMTKVRDYIQPK